MSEEVILKELQAVKAMLAVLVERQTVKHFYSTDEIAKLLCKAEFTVREWCRLGRIRAEKKHSGRGAHASWVISHAELLRYQREGLLPLKDGLPGIGRSG
jgi:transposase